jgi:hypothetical protein
VPPCAEYGPLELVAEEAIGGAFHVEQVLRRGADAAEDAEDRLDEEGRLDQAAIDDVRQVVEVPNVVALELEARAVGIAKLAEDAFDILECVPEDTVSRAFEVFRFPVVLEPLDPIGDGVEREVHRAHVQGAHFRLEPERTFQTLIDGHR